VTPRIPGTREQRAELVRLVGKAALIVPAIVAYAFVAGLLIGAL
jgi:hypothetical protein